MAIRVRKLRLLCSIAFLTILHSTSAASAEPPRPAGSATDDLRWHLDHVLATSQTASFRALDPVGRRAEIRRIVTGLFDWSEMSRRALGAQWRERSGPERRAFATRFGALAEHAYMGQVEQLSARGVPRLAYECWSSPGFPLGQGPRITRQVDSNRAFGARPSTAAAAARSERIARSTALSLIVWSSTARD